MTNYHKKYFRPISDEITNNITKIPETYSRNISGHNPVCGHPFISGYWYLMLKPPIKLFENIDDSNIVQQNYIKTFNSTAESFTPPTKSLVKNEIIGFGGVKKQIITGQETSNSFSIGFREQQNLPVFNMINHWNSVVDPITGAINNGYKGQCIVIIAKPTFSDQSATIANLTIDDVEEILFFDGVFPENLPIDSLDSDIATNDTKLLNINFNFDINPLTKVHEFNLDAFLIDFKTNVGDYNLPEPYTSLPA